MRMKRIATKTNQVRTLSEARRGQRRASVRRIPPPSTPPTDFDAGDVHDTIPDGPIDFD
jgi:hypothetical protein